MKLYIYITLLTFFFSACTFEKKTNTKDLEQVPSTEISLPADSINNPITTSDNSKQHTAQLDSIIYGHVLMPVTYRIWEGDAVSKIINNQWQELHYKNDAYYVAPASYHIELNDEEPCSGLPTETIIPKENAVVFFNIPAIQKGKVDSIAFSNAIVEPGKPFDFTFQNQSYRLVATGIQFYKDENRYNPKARYELKLYKAGNYVKTLINQSEYNDTATEIKFIGDLDRDGEPDFIFSSPRDYEEMRTLIILSRTPAAYEGTMQFDC